MITQTVHRTPHGVRIQITDTHPVQMCRYGKGYLPIEEVVSLLQCEGMSTEDIFRWLERRMMVGRFTPKEVKQ